MTYQQPSRLPPSLDIAAATAVASSEANAGGLSSNSSFASEQYQQQQQQQQHGHHHPYQAQSAQYHHAPQHHHHHSAGQAFSPIYSAPAMTNGASYYGSNGLSSAINGSLTHSQQYGEHSPSPQHQGGYGGVAMHPSAAHNGGAVPFGLSSSNAPSQQAQQFSSPASSSAYGGVSANGNGYLGSHGGVHHHHQLSAPHSFHSFHQRGTTNVMDSSASAMSANASAYDFQHSNVPYGVGLDTNGALLASHGFDPHSMLSLKAKRKQVKNACVNCQKACKRCDEGRPCSRCVKYGLTATCTDSARKERKRGIKRGPYKRRATTGSQPEGYASSLNLPQNGTSSGGAAGSTGGIGQSYQHYQHQHQHQHPYHPHHMSTSPLSPHLKASMSASINGSSNDEPNTTTAATNAHHAFEANAPLSGTASTTSHSVISGVGDDSPHPFASAVSRTPNSAMGPSTSYEDQPTTSSSIYSSSSAAPTVMQPPLNRPAPNARAEFDRSTIHSNAFAPSLYGSTQSSLGSNGVRSAGVHAAGVQQPQANGSAMPLSNNYTGAYSTNGLTAGLSSHRSTPVPSLFSPSSFGPSTGGSGGASTNGFQNVGSHVTSTHANNGGSSIPSYQHRMYSSESSLATLSTGSGNSTSTINSPRTPMGIGSNAVPSSGSNNDVNMLAHIASPHQGLNEVSGNAKLLTNEGHSGGHVPSYIHHSASNTLNSVHPVTAGAFLNPPLSSPGQSFALHIPQSARFRGAQQTFDPSKPRSAEQEREELSASYNSSTAINSADMGLQQRGLPVTSLNGSDLAPLRSLNPPPPSSSSSSNANTSTTTASRYQLPSPRMGLAESRYRPMFKVEANGNHGDVAAYGTA